MEDKVGPEEMAAACVVVEGELQRAVAAVGNELKALQEHLVADLRERLDEIDRSPLAAEVAAEFGVHIDRPEVDGPQGGWSDKQRKVVAKGM